MSDSRRMPSELRAKLNKYDRVTSDFEKIGYKVKDTYGQRIVDDTQDDYIFVKDNKDNMIIAARSLDEFFLLSDVFWVGRASTIDSPDFYLPTWIMV